MDDLPVDQNKNNTVSLSINSDSSDGNNDSPNDVSSNEVKSASADDLAMGSPGSNYYQPVNDNADVEPIAAKASNSPPPPPSATPVKMVGQAPTPATIDSFDSSMAAAIPSGERVMDSLQNDFIPTPPVDTQLQSDQPAKQPKMPSMPQANQVNSSNSVVQSSAAPTADRMVQRLQQANQAKKQSGGKSKALLLVAVLVVLLVSAMIVLFWRQSQSNLNLANQMDNQNQMGTTANLATPTPQPEIPPEVLNPPKMPMTKSLAGTVCSAGAGQIFFYNTTTKVVYSKEVTAGDIDFEVSVPAGMYKVFFESSDGSSRLGYADTRHNLIEVDLETDSAQTDLEVCDLQMNNQSVPQERYGFGGQL